MAGVIQPSGNRVPGDRGGNRSIPLFTADFVGANQRLECLPRLPPPTRSGSHTPAPVVAEPIMREATAKNPRLTQAEFPREPPDLLLFVVDQIAARLCMHVSEAVAHRPYTTAEALAGLKHDDAPATPLKLAGSCEPREPGANDQHGRWRHGTFLWCGCGSRNSLSTGTILKE